MSSIPITYKVYWFKHLYQVESVLLSVPISFYIFLPNCLDATVKYKFSFKYYQNHILSNIFDCVLLQKRVYIYIKFLMNTHSSILRYQNTHIIVRNPYIAGRYAPITLHPVIQSWSPVGYQPCTNVGHV